MMPIQSSKEPSWLPGSKVWRLPGGLMALGSLIALVIYGGSSMSSSPPPPLMTQGIEYRAILMDTATLRINRAILADEAGLTAHPLRQPTTIIESDRILYILERSVGIHVYDNFRPTAPVRTAFLRLPGVESMFIEGNRLYTNCGRDLLALQVLSPAQISLGQVIRDAYPNLAHPAGLSEKIIEALGDDPTRHHIIRWEPIPVP